MRVIIIASILLVAAQATFSSQFEDEWAKFKKREGKQYEDEEEDAMRKTIFEKNIKFVEEHNKKYKEGKVSYTVRINKFSDMTQTELRMFNGYKPSKSSEGVPFNSRANVQVPDSIDWRSKGAVTSVKNQGLGCGSCWAFSAVGALEGQFFLKYGKLVSLSEQNLVDCSTNDTGCGGGLPSSAFGYVANNGGIDTEESYPYEGKNDECRYKAEHSAGKINGYVLIQRGNETDLKNAVATAGPISVCIDASNRFFHFHGDVFDEPLCAQDLESLNHAVLVVGYGTTHDGKDYWLVKNSWGSRWGDKGYIRMARNKNNQCGIASDANYPIAT